MDKLKLLKYAAVVSALINFLFILLLIVVIIVLIIAAIVGSIAIAGTYIYLNQEEIFEEKIVEPFFQEFYEHAFQHTRGDLMEIVSQNILLLYDSPEKRAYMAHQFVSKYTVYDSDVLYDPKSPNKTLAEGGDCEDYSFLYCAMLKKMNIYCEVISLKNRRHSISKIRLPDGSIMFVDATDNLGWNYPPPKEYIVFWKNFS